jgi:hypothetical protein
MKLTMKRKRKLMALIASVAIFMLWSNTPTENTGKNIQTSAIKGNKTIDGDFVLNDGLISPGFSPGKITVTGDFSMGSSATYECELKDLTGAGSGHDQIDVTGNISLAGNLNIALDGYTPNNADQFEIMKFTGTLSGTFTITWAGTMLADGWQIDYGVLAPNKITIYGLTSSLPVELLSFKGNLVDNQIILDWITASELNNLGFEIQKSNEGREWRIIDFVEGQGTSAIINEYRYNDLSPLSGINYYRLKQIDFDGAFEYSDVIAIEYANSEKNIQIFPNPSNKLINIQINNPSNQRMRIKATDNLGRTIWESGLIEGESNWRKEMEFERNGIYFITAQIGDEIVTKRVLINEF